VPIVNCIWSDVDQPLSGLATNAMLSPWRMVKLPPSKTFTSAQCTSFVIRISLRSGT
jgi:hypothetical protein